MIEIKEDMTKKEMLELCEENGIKANAKMTIQQIKDLIDQFNKKEVDNDEGLEDNMTEEEYKELMSEPENENSKDENKKKVSRNEITRKQKREMMKLRRVQITCNDQTQTQREVHFVSWGNDFIGHYTDRVLIGRPWHVREGAYRNLKNAKFLKSVRNPNTGMPEIIEMPLWNIIDLPLKTVEEYRAMGKEKQMRDAAAEIATPAN